MNYFSSLLEKIKNFDSYNIKRFRHAEYNGKSKYWSGSYLKQLETMRDLRLWVMENAPHSKNFNKYQTQVSKITKEINYIRFLKLSGRILLLIAFVRYMGYTDEFTMRGAEVNVDNLPILYFYTRGITKIHEGPNNTHPSVSSSDKDLYLGKDFS